MSPARRFTSAGPRSVKARELTLGDEKLAMIVAASRGQRTRDIARTFFVSQRTVEYRLREAAVSLAASNRPHLVAAAIRSGLVDPVPCSSLSRLTDRELLVVNALSAGLTLATIAEHLGVSRPTVSARIRRAKTKTGSKTTCELAALAASGELEGDSVGIRTAATVHKLPRQAIRAFETDDSISA